METNKTFKANDVLINNKTKEILFVYGKGCKIWTMEDIGQKEPTYVIEGRDDKAYTRLGKSTDWSAGDFDTILEDIFYDKLVEEIKGVHLIAAVASTIRYTQLRLGSKLSEKVIAKLVANVNDHVDICLAAEIAEEAMESV